MNFRNLEYLIALYEHRNMTKAANSLYVSQPTLSRFLTSYEEELGALLFKRDNVAMVPTYVCERIVDHARKLLQQKREMDREISELTGKNRRAEITIGCTPSTSLALFPALVSKYKSLYPEVRVRLREIYIDEMETDLRSGMIDVMFTHILKNSPSILLEKVHNESLLLVLEEKNPLVAYAIPPQEDATYPWLDLDYLKDTFFITLRETSFLQKMIKEEFHAHGFEQKVLFTTRYIMTGLQLLELYSHAAIITDEIQWGAFCNGHRHHLRAFCFTSQKRPLYAAVRAGAYRTLEMRNMISVARQLFD